MKNKINKSENSPIRILHIMQDSFAHGGTPRKLLSLVSHGDKENFKHIFFLFANHTQNLNLELREAGAIVEEVNRPHSWDIRFLWDIIKMCNKHKCHIINTHFARADIYGTLASFFTRTPVVKSVHGILWNDSILLQRVDSLLSSLRVCTVCNSEATRQTVIRQTGAKNTKVIYNGVPVHSIQLTSEERLMKRNALGIPNDAFLIVNVGGMIELREQSVIIRALKHCIEQGVNAYLVFMGDGPLRKDLEAESENIGLSKKISFLGYRKDVPELNAIADVYINMAREEGFGIAVVEAMQAGVPVILANACALPELIEDGISGILVPVGDADSLAMALIKVNNNKELRMALGVEAKKLAHNKFSISRYVEDMENIYSEVVDKHHGN